MFPCKYSSNILTFLGFFNKTFLWKDLALHFQQEFFFLMHNTNDYLETYYPSFEITSHLLQLLYSSYSFLKNFIQIK